MFDLLAPPVCPACGESAAGLCRPCATALGVRPDPGCWRCGELVAQPGGRCGADHRELAHLAWHLAPFGYAGTGGALVRRFKLDGELAAGWLLARAMRRRLADRLVGPWRRAVVVPVPLHAARRRQRGFDQAAWLAGAVARPLGLRAAAGVLRRSRNTLPQGDPRVGSRAENVATAFAVVRPRGVVGRRVLLVDDVLTSGATARACAAVLLAAGAREVALLTACRS